MLTLVIASVGGTFAIIQILDLDNVSTSKPQGALLSGNVKVTQFDGDGNIIAYRQSDNHIVKSGMEIIMAQVFGGINGTYPMPAEANDVHPVRYMQIGTNGERRLLHNDTSIMTPVSAGACIRQLAGITNSSAQGAHGAPAGCDDVGTLCSAQMNVTATASFLGSASCDVASIDEAGIFDNSTTDTAGADATGYGNGGGLMFARNTFGSVTLNMLDTLQLDWEFTFTDS